jgi:hypothetical protein
MLEYVETISFKKLHEIHFSAPYHGLGAVVSVTFISPFPSVLERVGFVPALPYLVEEF